MKTKCPVIGIDVAKESSYYCILDPEGRVYRESFEAKNNLKSLKMVLQDIKKAEKEFGLKPVIILESTGHYSNPLVHFFAKKDFTILLINPLQSYSIKNSQIRKLKTDKVDAKELAELYFLKDLRPFGKFDLPIEDLKILTRAFVKLSEQRTSFVNQLSATVEQVMPRFNRVFADVGSKTSLEILECYASPDQMLKASKEEMINLIRTTSRKSEVYAAEKYDQLMSLCKESIEFGITLDSCYQLIKLYSKMVKEFSSELKKLKALMISLSQEIMAIDLLKSIPGIGEGIAPVIMAEIGNIQRFDNVKQLVAYCGLDPSVRQSGNFIGSKNRITKRGSKYIRRALYIAATVAIRKTSNGKFVNPVIHEYYQKKIQSKPRKQALGAVMNKLVRIIYAVLKSNQKFVLITPEEQVKLYRSNLKVVA